MSIAIEELDFDRSGLGELILRRRRYPGLGERDVFEVILNDEFLMSSLFTAGEIALAELALAAVAGDALDTLVGGLGLGYTATAVLADTRVRSLVVVEALPRVIAWHRDGLLPETLALSDDPRCRFHQGDFFAAARDGLSALGDAPCYDAIMLDIDHSPTHLLHASHASLYTAAGLADLGAHLRPGGVFGLWSNDAPDPSFLALLREAFSQADATVVAVDNPLSGIAGRNTIYVARHTA